MSHDTAKLIGSLPPADAGRDAIHVAVVPIVAGQSFGPGQHVGVMPDGMARDSDSPVGVVDPFLKTRVLKGERFYLFLYPGSITSLRHVWTHPAMADEGTTAPAPSAIESVSKEWMMAWAKKHMGGDYYGDNGALPDATAYENAIEAGRNLNVGPYESARDEIDDEWWNHWEAITGEPAQRGEFFSCAC